MMGVKTYLIIFDNDRRYEVNATDVKDAILKTAQYTGDDSDLFKKALKGFNQSDVEGLVELYNHFSCFEIETIWKGIDGDDTGKSN